MGVTGYTHNLTKFLRLYVFNHLTNKLSTTFRNTKSTNITANLFRSYAQGRSILENTQGFFVANRNLLRIKVGVSIFTQIFFQHLQYHRIVVPQNIKLNQTVIDAVIIVVGSNSITSIIVSRTVNRCDVVNIHITRHNHDTARVLTSCTLNPSQTFN